MKLLFSFCCVLVLLSACGFRPVYHKNTGEAQALAAIDIVTDDTREGQIFRTTLEDKLAPSGTVQARYVFRPNLAIRTEPLSIEADGTTRRYRLIGQSFMQLYDKDTNELLYTDKIERFTSYNIANADFSTYIGRQDATRQLLTNLADDIRFRLMRYFMQQEG